MIGHLLELRRRLLWVVTVYFVLLLVLVTFATQCFDFLVSPLRHALPSTEELIATSLMTPLFTPLQIAADGALLCTIPYALFHAWKFVAPGLYGAERQDLKWMLGLSVGMFVLGVIFCFYVVLPLMMQCLVHAVPQGVRLMPDMASAVDFITRIMVLFGLSFQVPLLCVVGVKSGLLTVEQLKKSRSYWIVSAFILGMLLAPPDVISQSILAVPLCLLYELGIVALSVFGLGNRTASFGDANRVG